MGWPVRLSRSAAGIADYQEAFGSEAVSGARGDTTLSELKLIAGYLDLAPGGLLLDLGCGIGGPGLWVARRLKAILLGLDREAWMLEQARQAAAGYPATYLQRDLRATGLEAGRADGALCLDAFWDPAILPEALRLLKPGGKLALTLVERLPTPLPGLIFEQDTPGWRERRCLLEPDRDLTGLTRRLAILRRPDEPPGLAP